MREVSVYQHTQTGTVTLIGLGGGGLVLLGVGAQTGFQPVVVLVALALITAAVFFSSLTVTVTREHLQVRFGPGPVRFTYATAEVRDARPVRNRWYYGWGIRLYPWGWMFSVAGLDAVEITFASGKRRRIGTDEPQRLVAAIRQAAGLEG